MGMQCVQRTKLDRIDKLLKNETYMPGSGMMQRLREQLQKLSKDDLGCLLLVVELKMSEAADHRQDILVPKVPRAANIGNSPQEMERNAEQWARENPGAAGRADAEASRQLREESEAKFRARARK